MNGRPDALPMTRLHDWQPRLAALIALRLGARFVWGQNDCCLFACDAVLAVTGHDAGADLRGTYATAAGAARVLQRVGGVAGVAIQRAGPVVPVALAQPGDVGVCKQDNGHPALAVYGGTVWHAPGPLGLTAHHASKITRAWRCTSPTEGRSNA